MVFSSFSAIEPSVCALPLALGITHRYASRNRYLSGESEPRMAHDAEAGAKRDAHGRRLGERLVHGAGEAPVLRPRRMDVCLLLQPSCSE